jgi:hypothetical protein
MKLAAVSQVHQPYKMPQYLTIMQVSRADFYGLWGNTLLHCFLFGDPNQPSPTVMTTHEKDAAGNLHNRFAADGAVSPLTFLMATGIPVFRLEASTHD